MERRTLLEEMAAGTSMPAGEQSSPDRIGLAGGDDEVTRVQLAARWAEAFAPGEGDWEPEQDQERGDGSDQDEKAAQASSHGRPDCMGLSRARVIPT